MSDCDSDAAMVLGEGGTSNSVVNQLQVFWNLDFEVRYTSVFIYAE